MLDNDKRTSFSQKKIHLQYMISSCSENVRKISKKTPMVRSYWYEILQSVTLTLNRVTLTVTLNSQPAT